MSTATDALELARALIRCPSVTPEDAGALAVLQEALGPLGFQCHRATFNAEGTPDVKNLYARIGTSGPNICFAGHTDVVPVGDANGWNVDPFGAEIKDGLLYGRGAADMKSAIACFIAAASRFLARRSGDFNGSISLLITGDEEGPAINGTVKMLDWLKVNGESLDSCLVGEPTNPEQLGEMIKIGRRGSLNGRLCVTGTPGHTAYPQNADNPLPRLVAMLDVLTSSPIDGGTEHFPPTNLQLTSIDVDNPTTNMIPGRATAGFNIRFNDSHSGDSLTDWLHKTFDAIGGDYVLDVDVSGEAFLTPPGKLSTLIADAVQSVTGTTPELSTTGGTSDARFIKDICPVAEFGLISATAHKADEHVSLDDIENLGSIYEAVLDSYFAT